MFPTVNFYQINPDQDNDNYIHKFICELIIKNYTNKKNIYILCMDQESCYNLDEYIITYQQTSFFPYQLIEPETTEAIEAIEEIEEINTTATTKITTSNNINLLPPAPICLGWLPATKLKHDILINLSNIIPDNFLNYKLIIELVTPHNIALSREHYKHYLKYNCQNKYNLTTTHE